MFQISQKVLLYNPEEKKFLFLKAANTDGGFYKNYGPWDLPGGRIDDRDEDASVALTREVGEEVGINVLLDKNIELLGRMEMQYTSSIVMNITFLARYQGGSITLSQEHNEFRWLTAEEAEKDSELKPWLKEYVKVAMARIQCQTYLDQWQRTQAEFENYKKRQATQQKELGGYLIEKLVLDIIPVLDNFRQATLHVPEEQKENPWVTGIQYIEKQLETVLTDNGMQTIEAKEGEAFDPKIHEAVSKAEGPESVEGTETQKHVIAKVVQKGYRLGEKVIRPARVVVK